MTALETAARSLMAAIDALDKPSNVPLGERIADRIAAQVKLRAALAEKDGQPLTPPMSTEADGFWWLWHQGEWCPCAVQYREDGSEDATWLRLRTVYRETFYSSSCLDTETEIWGGRITPPAKL